MRGRPFRVSLRPSFHPNNNAGCSQGQRRQPAKDIDVYHEKCTTILLKVKTSLPKTRKRRLVSDGAKDFK